MGFGEGCRKLQRSQGAFPELLIIMCVRVFDLAILLSRALSRGTHISNYCWAPYIGYGWKFSRRHEHWTQSPPPTIVMVLSLTHACNTNTAQSSQRRQSRRMSQSRRNIRPVFRQLHFSTSGIRTSIYVALPMLPHTRQHFFVFSSPSRRPYRTLSYHLAIVIVIPSIPTMHITSPSHSIYYFLESDSDSSSHLSPPSTSM